MKKLVCLFSLVSAASFMQVQAADYTLETWLAKQKASTEKKGKEFKAKDIKFRTKQFKAIDANGDGIMTSKENRLYWDKIKENRKKK